MPITAVDALVDVIPDELLSLLFSAGRAVVRIPDEIDHDEIAPAFGDYLNHKHQFHHPESECGPAIGPTEDAVLRGKVVALPIKGKVA
jgi:hypothetical protein